MRKILFLSTVLILLVSKLNADILDIPEVKVYGERKVEVEQVKKQLLPFEKEYIQPSFANMKKGLPIFKVLDKKAIKRNIGCRLEAAAGTYLGGYLLGYARENFQPLEVGLNFIINSVAQDSLIQIFSRTSFQNFYINGAFYGKNTSKPFYKFAIGNIHNLIDFDFFGVFSDTLIGVADIDFKYSPFKLNLQFETSIDFNAKVLYEKYPIQAGVLWFDDEIYPEFVYFLPVYDLYIKGSLLNKTGISYLYCQSLPYLREYASTYTYYRAEFGQSNSILPLSLIYSHYLNNSSNFIGTKLTYSDLFFELEYPLEDDYDYILRAGISTDILEIISANIYGYTNGTEKYFIGVDLGYDIRDYLRVGIEGDYIYGFATENDFDIGGYIFFAF
ncbi:hypothetical protein JW879_00045 [candidate division WOR-3 bacterium]|nr:hypothetical protein [candidate division WOR-3 bacterium]